METILSGVGVDAFEYDSETATVRTQFDQEKTPATMAVIASLAEVMDVGPIELEPLHSTLDPDALDALVHVRPGTEGDIHITFTHEDHAITVYSYGVVTISQVHEPPAETTKRGTER